MKNIACVVVVFGLVELGAVAGEARDTPVTFSEHIAPIVFEKCAPCHRPGEAAPFSLLDYQQAKKKASMMGRVTKSRFMPPWHAEPGHVEFLDDRRLSDAEIGLIAAWVENGAPEGNPKKLPKLPEFTEGWQLGDPDLVLSMAQAYEVPADGPDIYRNFVLPLGLAEDRWVRAIELRPSARTVLHHALYFLDSTGQARSRDGKDGKPGFRDMGFGFARAGGSATFDQGGWGQIGGWAVGATPKFLPQDLAVLIPKGSDIVLQSHFHPSGKSEAEATTIGLFFADEPPSRTLINVQMPPLFGALAGIDIAAGDKNYTLKDSFKLPVAVEGVSIGGHAHYLCTEMRMTATLPDQTKKILLHIARWDFNWQDRYTFKEAVELPAGTVLDVELHYDNSSDNPSNPSHPPKRVRWGRESTDEMGSLTLAVVAKNEGELDQLRGAVRDHGTRSAARRFSRAARGFGDQLKERLASYDKNGDGKIEESEVPERQRRMFRFLDQNGDGVITAEERKAIEDGARQLSGDDGDGQGEKDQR